MCSFDGNNIGYVIALFSVIILTILSLSRNMGFFHFLCLLYLYFLFFSLYIFPLWELSLFLSHFWVILSGNMLISFSDCLSLMCINTTNFHVLILCFTSGLAASFVSLNKCRVLFCFYGISGFSKYKIMNPVVCKQRPFGVVLDNL